MKSMAEMAPVSEITGLRLRVVALTLAETLNDADKLSRFLHDPEYAEQVFARCENWRTLAKRGAAA